ncbi:MAG: ATP-binding protein [Melioribacteraceae bacterium]|nr:ATP-binding protein [Melioribacteraceae bacterium]
MISRDLQKVVVKNLYKRKAIIITGPRQVGKTTMVRELAESSGEKFIWFNGDEPHIRDLLANKSTSELKVLLGKNKLVIIDEAQRIPNIGITIKLIVDNLTDRQVIVTGSSSLDIASELNEPLTGRKYEYRMFPLSFNEMVNETSYLEEKQLLEKRMIYGYYPGIINAIGEERELLGFLADSYLYKDIFTLGNIKKPRLLENLLQALALQVGNEVITNELSNLLAVDNATIERYINLLEKTFVIFQLPSLSRNMRNEIKKGRKIYFYDLGIRNAIINNFNSLNLRQDKGALWENYIIVERMKYRIVNSIYSNDFFWRTHTQQEIDFIEEYDGKLFAYEFKWNPTKKARFPNSFKTAYPNCETELINSRNYENFIWKDLANSK